MIPMLQDLPIPIIRQPNNTNDPSTQTRTHYYSLQHNHQSEQHNKIPKNKDAHLGITIRGSAAAAGGPPATGPAPDLAVDLHKIIAGWSPWC
jgi:hypothetical protein